MTSTEKIYIGKGNQVKDYDMFSIVINVSEAKKFTTLAKNGDKILKLTLTKTKNPDKFGNTHTAYVVPVQNETYAQEPPQNNQTKLEFSFLNH